MSTSRVRVYLGCSLDGCIAGPDHDISFLNEYIPDPDAPSGSGLTFEAFMEQVGALLMGLNWTPKLVRTVIRRLARQVTLR